MFLRERECVRVRAAREHVGGRAGGRAGAEKRGRGRERERAEGGGEGGVGRAGPVVWRNLVLSGPEELGGATENNL